MQAPDRPLALCCYICGREFGTASLAIHMKACLKKHENEQSKKQPKDRLKLPSMPEQLESILNGDTDIDKIKAYNEKAAQIHKYSVLPKCSYCNRTFNPQSLKAHEKGCSQRDRQAESKKQPASAYQEEFKKPRTLTCCVCGRDFGLSSLKIHYPQCVEKFELQEGKKPRAERKVTPAFTNSQLDMINHKQEWSLEEIEQFNNLAAGVYRDKAMVQCPNCGRKFLEESYHKHKKNCVMINGAKSPAKQPSAQKQNKISEGMGNFMTEYKKPRTLTCCVCGRDFGLASLKIHYPQCQDKFEYEEKKKPRNERKPTPSFTVEQVGMINSKQDWTLQEIDEFNKKSTGAYREQAMVQCPNCGRKFIEESFAKHSKNCVLINGNKMQKSTSIKEINPGNSSSDSKLKTNFWQFPKPRTLTCCICGRQFGLTSLKIHYPQCQQKFQNEENKKPKNQRKPTPSYAPELLQMVNNKQQWTMQQIEQFNSKASGAYRQKAMVQCDNCGRKFIAQSFAKHRKNCELINGESKNKSKSREQRLKSCSSDQKIKTNFYEFPKPRTLTCCVCGRQFGLTSLKIHYPQCQLKFQNQENKKPFEERKPTPCFNEEQLEQINNKQSWTNEQIEQFNSKATSAYREKAMVECGNCGRKFLAQSYEKHKKNCVLINGLKATSSKGNDFPAQAQTPTLGKKKSETIKNELYPHKIDEDDHEHLSKSPVDPREEEGKQKLEVEPFAIDSQKQVLQIDNNFLGLEQEISSKKNQQQLDKPQQTSIIGISSGDISLGTRSLKKTESCQEKKQGSNQEIQKKKSAYDALVDDILSPRTKRGEQKGFAAPRLKQEMLKALMKQCKICNRKFDSDRIQKHEMICSQNKKKMSEKNLKLVADTIIAEDSVSTSRQQQIKEEEPKLTERDILSPEEKIRMKKGFAEPRKKQIQSEMRMVECKGCKRKFSEERIAKHESICKQVQQMNTPFTVGSYKKIEEVLEEQKSSFKRLPCPKCNRKFAEERLQKHMEVCKAVVPNAKLQVKKQEKKPQPIFYQEDQNSQQPTNNLQLKLCVKCNRKFNPQRLEKHFQVCKGKLTESTQEKFYSKKPGNLPPSSPFKQYNLQSLDSKNEAQNLQRVQCSKCLRKFAPDRFEKHVGICKAVPPLSIIQQKPKNIKLQQPQKNFQQHVREQKIEPIFKDDQFTHGELEQCQKCTRKFYQERIAKHRQICKGEKPRPNIGKNHNNLAPLPVKPKEEQIRKTKNEFFSMVRDLKQKRVNNEDIQLQIQNQLHQIQATHKIRRKQNPSTNASPKTRSSFNKSVMLPKI